MSAPSECMSVDLIDQARLYRDQIRAACRATGASENAFGELLGELADRLRRALDERTALLDLLVFPGDLREDIEDDEEPQWGAIDFDRMDEVPVTWFGSQNAAEREVMRAASLRPCMAPYREAAATAEEGA